MILVVFFQTNYLIDCFTMTVTEVKVVVVFDAENSGLSTHKETYKGYAIILFYNII